MLPRVVGIDRHRLLTDGEGVTTLVAFHGCPLHCRYCLNPHALAEPGRWPRCRCRELYEETKIDELYFLATGGGVTFGGGEPALYPGFISEFRSFCGERWSLSLETSLNVPTEHIERLLPVVNRFIVDIKDMNPDIYCRYTGKDNTFVLENLRLLLSCGRVGDIFVRIPLIPGYNTEDDCRRSKEALEAMGVMRFDLFTYLTNTNYEQRKTDLSDIERYPPTNSGGERH